MARIAKERRPPGRPEKEINWEMVDKLLEAGCSGAEICPHFNLHYSNFYDRVVKKYGVSFTEYAQEKRQKGESVLRAKQFEKAVRGDNMMLIWLGKNRLKQSDSPTQDAIAAETLSQYASLMKQLESFQTASREPITIEVKNDAVKPDTETRQEDVSLEEENIRKSIF